jgi:hypothetical protein
MKILLGVQIWIEIAKISENENNISEMKKAVILNSNLNNDAENSYR